MLNNSLFYSKNLNADRQNKWCCFDLMLPGKSYWQAEYLQHLTALAWRWWYGRSFCPTTLDSLQSPNNVEMIQSCWIFCHSVYGHKMLLCFIQTIGWWSVRKWGSSFDGNQDMRWKQIEKHLNTQTFSAFQWSYLFHTSQFVGVTKHQFSSTMCL